MHIQIRKRNFLSIIVALALVLQLALVVATPASAATINVPGDYGTIQEAINNANPGDTSYHQIAKLYPANPGVELRIGSYGSGDGQFNYPSGVAVDASCNVYVADAGNCRVQTFTSSSGFLPIPIIQVIGNW